MWHDGKKSGIFLEKAMRLSMEARRKGLKKD
jgi:hypothetical protein